MISFIELPKDTGLNVSKLKSWLIALAAEHDKRIAALNYNFVDDADILDINMRHLNHDYITDIITFEYNRRGKIYGDIFICAPQLRRQALEYNQTVDQEFLRVIAHGLLHLVGFKDGTDDEKDIMRREEEKALILHAKI